MNYLYGFLAAMLFIKSLYMWDIKSETPYKIVLMNQTFSLWMMTLVVVLLLAIR